MLLMIALLLIATAAGIYQLPKLLRKRQFKEAWVYCILLATGVAVSIPAVLLTDSPSPLFILRFIYKPFNDMLVHIFK